MSPSNERAAAAEFIQDWRTFEQELGEFGNKLDELRNSGRQKEQHTIADLEERYEGIATQAVQLKEASIERLADRSTVGGAVDDAVARASELAASAQESLADASRAAAGLTSDIGGKSADAIRTGAQTVQASASDLGESVSSAVEDTRQKLAESWSSFKSDFGAAYARLVDQNDSGTHRNG